MNAVANDAAIVTKNETRDGMRIDWDVAIPMDDGLVLRADVFRPVAEGRYPVLISYGPYAKGLAFQEGYPSAWNRMAAEHPDVTAGSTNKYQNWEVVDPEKWVPDGYVLRSRGLRGLRSLARIYRSFLRRVRRKISMTASNGRQRSLGVPARSALMEFLITELTNGMLPRSTGASCGDVHLGGRGRLVPRHDASRRHSQHVLGQLVRHASQDCSIRRWRKGKAQRGYR